MAAEEKTPGRGTIATVVATAAVTLAIGVTAAALGGYLVPARDGDKTTAVQPSEPIAVEERPTRRPAAPNVVLVPVAPDGRGEPPPAVATPREPEVLLAAYAPFEHDDDTEGDHHPSRRHHEREDEDDHDDDD